MGPGREYDEAGDHPNHNIRRTTVHAAPDQSHIEPGAGDTQSHVAPCLSPVASPRAVSPVSIDEKVRQAAQATTEECPHRGGSETQHHQGGRENKVSARRDTGRYRAPTYGPAPQPTLSVSSRFPRARRALLNGIVAHALLIAPSAHESSAKKPDRGALAVAPFPPTTPLIASDLSGKSRLRI